MRHALWFVLIVVVSVVPLLVLAGYAVAPGWRFPELLPHQFEPRALLQAAEQGGRLLAALGSSVLYSLSTALLALALCLVPARHLARADFRGKTLVEGLLLAPALVPPMTFSMGVHVAFIRLGLIDTTLGVVLVLTTFSYPYMLRALVAGYESVGERYGQCACNLGAGWWLRLTRVDLPLLLPAAVAGGSVVFLVAFSEYFLVFLIGGGRVESLAGMLFPLLTSSDRASGSVLTLLFFVVPLALFVLVELLVARRYRARGMA